VVTGGNPARRHAEPQRGGRSFGDDAGPQYQQPAYSYPPSSYGQPANPYWRGW
jgi:hypothetical protein